TPELLIYYCVDDWSHAHAYDGARLAVLERDLCRRADLVFATSSALVAARRMENPRTYLAPHGVEHAHLARALDPATPVAPEIARLPRPIIAMVGLIDERVDLALLAELAERRPGWTFVLAGRTTVDCTALARHPNVRLLGHWPYARLPELLRGVAVGLIPFVMDEYTRHVKPLKLREYLS